MIRPVLLQLLSETWIVILIDFDYIPPNYDIPAVDLLFYLCS